TPTLTELWDAKASVEVRGPEGINAKLKMSLARRDGVTLAGHSLNVLLPIDAQRWSSVFRQIRDESSIQRVYEESEACSVEVSHPQLGSVSLRAEREFTPLRWVFRRDSDGPFVRLVDNTGGAATISYFSFAAPDRAEAVGAGDAAKLRRPAGGLCAAAS